MNSDTKTPQLSERDLHLLRQSIELSEASKRNGRHPFSGAAPVESLLAAGIAVGLGTDGEKENNNLDMFEEMKTASLLAKFSQLDAAALDAWSVCRMATATGARALGMDKEIGTLEPGKAADLIAVRTDTPRM